MKKILILGGGTAGWMTANLLAKKWQDKAVEISVLESPEIGIVGVGEGSTPSLKRFFEILGITEQQWMGRCHGTWKTNIRFRGWSPASGIDEYSHPFTTQIDTFTHKAFTVNCQTRRLGLDTHTRPEDFLLNGVLANQGKSPLNPANFPFQMEYGYHFDSALLGQFLAEFGAEQGIKHYSGRVVDVQTHVSGDIDCLITENGQQYQADFFIDCSGFSSLLMQKKLGVKFCSFADNLFNNAAVVGQTPMGESIPVETLSTALSAGWCWKIPLTHRYGNGYVYSDDFISSGQAEEELAQHLKTPDITFRHLKMKVGQLEQHWQKNCLAVGLSQGFIEPLEATALHLVQVAVEMFIQDVDEQGLTSQCRDQYNRKISERFERVRDYIVAHYKLNTRDDSDYWRANRNNNVLSDSLRHILDVWYQCGDLSAEIERQKLNSHFDGLSWHCLLAGYGTFPALGANQPGRGDLYQEQNIQSFLQGCAQNYPSHHQSLTLMKSSK